MKCLVHVSPLLEDLSPQAWTALQTYLPVLQRPVSSVFLNNICFPKVCA